MPKLAALFTCFANKIISVENVLCRLVVVQNRNIFLEKVSFSLPVRNMNL
jgi:hypothetical protein